MAFPKSSISFHFDRAAQPTLLGTPYLDSRPRGVLATHAPARPNPIGLSVLRLLPVEGTRLIPKRRGHP